MCVPGIFLFLFFSSCALGAVVLMTNSFDHLSTLVSIQFCLPHSLTSEVGGVLDSPS